MSVINCNFRSRTTGPDCWHPAYATTAYYNISRREFKRILKNVKKHRYVHVSNGHGMGGTKTKLFGSNLKGMFDTRKGHLYITYRLFKEKDQWQE